MRTLNYFSPTSLSLYYANRDEFYMKYLSDNRPPKIPQTPPMAAGSSFDAYVKNYLHQKLIGIKDEKFDLDNLFNAQVESQHRDQLKSVGKHIFDEYVQSGCLADLILELEGCIGAPKFESEIHGVINGYRESVTLDTGGVRFLGKPDVFFINKYNAHIILDWKVNGYFSRWPISPMKGFIKVREKGKHPTNHHKDAFCMLDNGINLNVATCLEDLNEDWARQLAIYAWLCGEEIGNRFIVAIDQVVCKPNPVGGPPSLRFAQHRLRIGESFQWKVFADAQKAWDNIQNNWVFDDRPKEDSIAHCALLDKRDWTDSEFNALVRI